MRDDEFEWDDRKAKRNDREHGVTFEIARFVFDDPNAIDRLDLDEPGEDRELVTGLVGDVSSDSLFRAARSSQAHHLGPKGNVP